MPKHGIKIISEEVGSGSELKKETEFVLNTTFNLTKKIIWRGIKRVYL
jgi:hypothetical protein